MFNRFSKSRLLPHTYGVKVHKDGYQEWVKNIKIEGGVFESFHNIKLLPLEIQPETAASVSFTGANSIVPDPHDKNILIISSSKKSVSLSMKDNVIINLPAIPTVIKKASTTSQPETPGIISPDTEKEIIISNNEINVTWLRDSGSQPYMKTGQSVLMAKLSSVPKYVAWYQDSNYILYQIQGTFKMSEIDTRDGINTYDLIKTSSPLYYNNKNGFLYTISGKNILKYDLNYER
ncbi:MAG: hypothetical protein CEN90_112 [Parcubacteria group bacterium Licking1014_17]|nr:MAG: hypothetical protein CEN90_112 [Parcubacteria group bacterium Licking1014_17]